MFYKHHSSSPKIQTKRPNLRVFCQEHTNGIIAYSEDPDQTAPRSSLVWVCTVCPDLSVQKLYGIQCICHDSHGAESSKES